MRVGSGIVNTVPYGDMSLKKDSLDRESWLEQALSILREEGIQGVRVERLARDLGVTKGSFYWHFKNRDDLQQSILNYWVDQYNDVVIENRDLLQEEPAQGLLTLMTRVRADGLDKYETAMRAWADHDEMAKSVVNTVDDKRKKLVKGFFSRMGFRGLDAEVRTRLTLCYLSWEPNMYPDEPKSRRLKLVKLQHELLTKR